MLLVYKVEQLHTTLLDLYQISILKIGRTAWNIGLKFGLSLIADTVSTWEIWFANTVSTLHIWYVDTVCLDMETLIKLMLGGCVTQG